ncbi:hypothetical protein D3C72_554790 [compost metagenome]
MRSVTLSFPQLALIVGTRALAAAGVALLLADRLDRRQRRAVGATLAAVGAITTLPLAAEVVSATRPQRPTPVEQGADTDRQARQAPLTASR